MQKHVLVLTTSAFILACGATVASAQEGPMTQQPQLRQQQQDLERQLLERQRQGAQSPRRRVEDDGDEDDDSYRRPRMGRDYRPGWHQDWGRGAMGVGMMGRGGMMGPGSTASGMMMQVLFTLMDSDGDGSLSIEEFQAAHARIFKGMDANKDGKLTIDEMQTFMQGPRRSAPRQ